MNVAAESSTLPIASATTLLPPPDVEFLESLVGALDDPVLESIAVRSDRDSLNRDLAACRPDDAELRGAWRRLYAKAATITALAATSYTVVLRSHRPALVAPAVVLLSLIAVATATSVMHDANHGAFGPSRRVNALLSYSSDLLGASSWLWRQKHNRIHHANTNVVGVDTDIEQMPIARLAPGQPWRAWHRYQHLYLWVLYGFLSVQWVAYSDVSELLHKRIGNHELRPLPTRGDAARLLGFKALHLAWALGIPMLFHRWWTVLACYLVGSWLVGITLAVFFQVAHCVDKADFASPEERRRGDAFARHQLRTTVDVGFDRAWILRPVAWLMGGLQFQIEHHLAPAIPHTAYPAMAARVREVCRLHAVDYRCHESLFAAIGSHARWLRTMGANG